MSELEVSLVSDSPLFLLLLFVKVMSPPCKVFPLHPTILPPSTYLNCVDSEDSLTMKVVGEDDGGGTKGDFRCGLFGNYSVFFSKRYFFSEIHIKKIKEL